MSKILITGGAGFLGKHLAKELAAHDVECPTHDECNLESFFDVETLFETVQPDLVYHLAGYNGGIQMNLDEPADIFTRNTQMALNVLRASSMFNVKKVVSVVASCAYPMQYSTCYHDAFFDGEPNPTVECHAYAKRNLQLATKFYHQQYGLDAVCVCPTTLYGPGDSYDASRTKVMGAMIRRFIDAVDNEDDEVVCWGTGAPLREFLYVKDAAKLIAKSTVYTDHEKPLNLSSGQEISIKNLADLVARKAGFAGIIKWDHSKPDGQQRKHLYVNNMNKLFRDFAFTPLEEGIEETVEDYRANVRQEIHTSRR